MLLYYPVIVLCSAALNICVSITTPLSHQTLPACEASVQRGIVYGMNEVASGNLPQAPDWEFMYCCSNEKPDFEHPEDIKCVAGQTL